MAYGYKKYSKKSYQYRKKAYKGTKKRFSKKRFIRSNYGKTIVKAPVNARDTYVKLPFLRTFQPNIAAASSQTYIVLGNSLIPMPAVYTGVITAGDTWCSGVTEYASFYSNYRVLGSSLNVQITAISANNIFRVVLIPVMNGGQENGSAGSVNDRLTELNALTYDQLAQQPFAQAKTLGLASGGNATAYMKCFRKTKYMLSCKDIKDNVNTLLNLPDTDGTDGEVTVNADSSFFYYIRIFNSAGAQAQTVEVQVKAKYYTQLTSRTNWVPTAVPV